MTMSATKIEPEATARVGVAIVEDVGDIRGGLAALIDGTDGYCCLGAWGSMEEALHRIRSPLPDVVLVDIGLPGMTGIEGIRILRERYPDLAMLVLSVYDDDRRIFDALCAGATGYLLKKTPPAKLLESIVDAAKGGAPMSPAIARKVIRIFREIRPPERPEYGLTPHEQRILGLLAEGHHYKTAAAKLGVTFHAVSFHLRNIYRKLHVQSKSEAVAKALREHLLD
jgi:DNA-binding NarL/FixJ family response regulator